MKGNQLKCLILACVLAVMSVLSGCGFKDIDKRFFVVSIGVDRSDKPPAKYKVELKLAIPSSEEKFGSNLFIIVTEEAETITEAVRIMKSKVDKELDFGHAKAIVFGEKFIKDKHALSEVLDWFVRRRDIQMISWVGMGRPDAMSILMLNPQSERLPSNMIFLSFGQTGTHTSYIVSEYLFDMRRRLKERGLDPILPIIEKRSKDQIQINKVALFSKEEFVMELDSEETKILNTFYQNIGKSDVKVYDGEHTFIVSVDDIQSNIRVIRSAGGRELPRVEVAVKMNGIIEEAKHSISLSKLKSYERLTEKEIADRAQKLFNRMQKAGIDLLGIGLKYRSTHMTDQADWEQWQSQYRDIPITVQAKVKLQGTGVIE
ncbi:Ger(x)C family spore germination protein [Paenibacillus chartarius]|uniref:Ger(X)C family spore germination protein n=1 Tax=Paenibacillus chartarius TaxID=747481 RepID=A0ABV6DE41_9BACL